MTEYICSVLQLVWQDLPFETKDVGLRIVLVSVVVQDSKTRPLHRQPQALVLSNHGLLVCAIYTVQNVS